jgi:hypothetical protein
MHAFLSSLCVSSDLPGFNPTTCDAPGFLISVNIANDRVKPVDSSQTFVNLGHYLKNKVNNP